MKNWKKSKVVMLPTEKASEKSICMNQVNGGLFIPERRIHGNKIFEVSNYGRDILGTTPQHLYILSDEEIKEGDWYINLSNNFIGQEVSVNILASIKLNPQRFKKIIATTDESLTEVVSLFHGETDKPLPRPSNEFLKKYCEVGGIDEVLVEYSYTINKSMGHFNQFREYKLKVAPDNTITIKPIKNSWSREEVEKLLILMGNEYALPINREDRRKYIIKWIKENL